MSIKRADLSVASRRSLWFQLVALLIACAIVYWFRLGSGGFFGTEAHRAIPAYEMLDHAETLRDWLVPRMFEQPYLRKPPGMPWAIAGMSVLFGETVFAARAVSAVASTLMAFVAFFFAKRWFGPRAALPAGLAQALMPVLWETGRAAEIEPLNHLGTQLAALFIVESLLVSKTRRAQVLAAITAAIGIILFGLAKGPASIPVVVGVVVAICVVRRSARPLAGVLWVTLGTASLFFAGFGWLLFEAANSETRTPVTQSPSAFLFEPGMILEILTLPFASFVQMLPASFALLFFWGRDAREEIGKENWSDQSFQIARTLTIAWLVTVFLFMAFGVRNPRYTLPAAVLLAPIAGALVPGVGVWMTDHRTKIARVMLLGRGAVLAGVLLVGSLVYGFTVESNRRATSATEVGEAIGAEIHRVLAANPTSLPVTLLANDVIEARPELVLEIERSMQALGHDFTVIWVPDLAGLNTPYQGGGQRFALLRIDASSPEADLTGVTGQSLRFSPIGSEPNGWKFHKYRAALYLVNDW